MKLLILGHTFAYEMECVVRLFFHGIKLDVLRDETASVETCAADTIVTFISNNENGGFKLFTSVNADDSASQNELSAPSSTTEKELERLLAVSLYKLLCEHTGIRPPWGVLTGIRPVRFCRTMAEKGLSERSIYDVLTGDYLVSPDKARLALATSRAEESILSKNHNKAFSLYISIPFCPSRCLYCSFISHDIKGCTNLVPDYIRLLCEEIKQTAELTNQCGLELQTVYIGGGTPTALEAGELGAIMSAVRESFNLSALLEYTVEAGRPDTVTKEKLAVIKEYGATRISVNPQTMNDAVLRVIGRDHTAAQTLEAFTLAREAGFANINMDIIAGLPGDDINTGFSRTIDKVLELKPENVTVHTLTVKRSSGLKESGAAFDPEGRDIPEMLDKAASGLSNAGYHPYYMYRQKGTPGNLENTGYSLPGYEGIYNVYIMEETHTVLAVGAGAVTKLCNPVLGVKRVRNYKYPYEYIGGFDEILRRKTEVKRYYDRAYAGT